MTTKRKFATEETQESYEQSKAKAGLSGSSRFYRPCNKKSRDIIRIVPYFENEAYPRKFGQHWNVSIDGRPIPCPSINLNQRCPICEDKAKIYARGDTEGAKKLAPNTSFLVQGFVRESDTPHNLQIIELGYQMWEKYNAGHTDSKGHFRNIKHPDKGRDFVVIKGLAPDGKNASYTNSVVDDEPSSIGIADWQQQVQDFDSVMKDITPSYEEVTKLYLSDVPSKNVESSGVDRPAETMNAKPLRKPEPLAPKEEAPIKPAAKATTPPPAPIPATEDDDPFAGMDL